MTEYLKMVPLPSWWQKLELNDLSISELFEDLLSWNSESKLITPKNITGTYFGAIMAIFNFSFSVCFLYVMFFLTPEWAPKAGPATCFFLKFCPISASASYKAHSYIKKSVYHSHCISFNVFLYLVFSSHQVTFTSGWLIHKVTHI